MSVINARTRQIQHENPTDCSSAPAIINGFESYAPDMAYSGGGFPPDAFANLAKMEAENFWFRARNEFLLWVFQRYKPEFRSFLEIGCGTGYVLSGVAQRFPKAKLCGSEIFVDGLTYAKGRAPAARFIQADARNLPFKQEFEIIGAFDVLEHIPEDECVLDNIFKALKPDGLAVLTVPQHMWLWSPMDEEAHHVRRYENKPLLDKLHQAGFKVLRSTSFVSLLLPAMLLARMQKRKQQAESGVNELKLPKALNGLFYAIMKLESLGIRMGVNYPVGGSRLIVAQKPSASL